MTKKMLNDFPLVENMTSVNGNYVPNQYIIHHKNRIIFQSYNSIIAVRRHIFEKFVFKMFLVGFKK